MASIFIENNNDGNTTFDETVVNVSPIHPTYLEDGRVIFENNNITLKIPKQTSISKEVLDKDSLALFDKNKIQVRVRE